MYDVEMKERKCSSCIITVSCNCETHQEKESREKLDHCFTDAEMIIRFYNASDFIDKSIMKSY